MFKIILNKELDFQTYKDFNTHVKAGADFGAKIRADHPNITKENYIKYIDDFYAANNEMLNNALKDTESCFNEIKDPLFSELKKYFGKDYSKENYTCCLSIFDCNPRWIETKSFQVYYKRSHDMRRKVIAHELTHFAFYDFCIGLRIKSDKNLWELSEIFNVIFLNLPTIQKAIGKEELLFYPELKDKLKEIKQVFIKQPDAKKFIVMSLEYLQLKNNHA